MKQHLLNSFVALCDGQTFSYVDLDVKQGMHRAARAVLMEFVEHLGIDKSDFEIRSNYAGIACSGEITLHAVDFYMQINLGMRNMEILIRSCEGLSDFTGGTNHFKSIKDLLDPHLVIEVIRQVAPLREAQAPLQIELLAAS